MASILICLIIVLTSSSYAMGDKCPYKTNFSEVESIVEELIYETEEFKSLVDIDLEIIEFKNDEYYFATNIKRVFSSAEKRIYQIKVNQKLYECAPSLVALRAILAHELFHVVDYYQTRNLLFWLGSYVFSPATIERETDRKTVYAGFSDGLIDYRNWIYQQLSPSQLKRKQRRYLTPKEILSLSSCHNPSNHR